MAIVILVILQSERIIISDNDLLNSNNLKYILYKIM